MTTADTKPGKSLPKVPPCSNFVQLVEKDLNIKDLLETTRAMRRAQPTNDSDLFPFYQSNG